MSWHSMFSRATKLLHYALGGLLLAGGLGYWYWKPSTLNPMADPKAAEALALVQTHRAQHAPTVLQAINSRVQTLEAQGQGVRLGEWRVKQEQGDSYLVRIVLREEETKQWVEREYLWRVNLATKTVDPLTLSATSLMPLESVRPMPSATFLPQGPSLTTA